MEAHEPDEHRRNHEDMQRKESGKRRAGDDRPTQHQFHNSGALKRNRTRDRRSDPPPTICVLIEPQHLPAECHAQGHQQKEYTDDPGEFSGKFVGPKKEDLDHMNENNRHHEVRAPSMQRADEPAESHVVVESLQTAPRLASRWNVNQGKQNSCDELQKEHDKSRAAEDVPPTRRVARYAMLRHLANTSHNLPP